MTNAISATKFRNAVRKIDPSVKCAVKNVTINGELRGFSGFITNNDESRFVYVNHEVDPWSDRDEGMYRIAKHNRDYRGGRNRFTRGETMPERAIELLKSDAYEKDGFLEGDKNLRELRGW